MQAHALILDRVEGRVVQQVSLQNSWELELRTFQNMTADELRERMERADAVIREYEEQEKPQ